MIALTPALAAAAPIPPMPLNGYWVTVIEFARVMNRAERTIYYWLREGILEEFGIPTYRDSSGKWWIFVKS